MSKHVSTPEQASRDIFIIAKAFDTAGLLIRCITIVAIVYIAHLIIGDLAGKVTWASLSFALKYVGESKKTLVAPWISATLLGVWATIERKLRKRHIKRAQEHIESLEARLDPKRTGSKLTAHGDTNPKDKI